MIKGGQEMKKLLLYLSILIVIVSATGCSNSKETSQVTQQQSTENNSKATQKEEIKETLEEVKKKAVKANFIDMNTGKKIDGYVYITGEVLLESGTEKLDWINVTTEEGNGYGIYSVLNMVDEKLDIKDGDIVTFYGIQAPKREETGAPSIVAEFYEKGETK